MIYRSKGLPFREADEKLRIACGSDARDNAILEMFLATGCRVSEVANMRIEDIDIKDKRNPSNGTAEVFQS